MKMAKAAKAVQKEEVQQSEVVERDPILDEEVVFTMKVEQVNVILSLLGKLPYVESSEVITNLRNYVIAQLQEKQKAANSELVNVEEQKTA